MAERVNDVSAPRRRRYYPWDKWTDGAVWRAKQDEDFTCNPASFQTALHLRARQEGLNVTTGSPEEGIIEFQFSPKNPNDRDDRAGHQPVTGSSNNGSEISNA